MFVCVAFAVYAVIVLGEEKVFACHVVSQIIYELINNRLLYNEVISILISKMFLRIISFSVFYS